MGIFAKRLQESMDAKNINQLELSKRSGISKSMINEYLKGKYVPKTKNLTKLAQVLEVNAYYLLGTNDEPASKPATPEQIKEWDKKYNLNGKVAQEAKMLMNIRFTYGEMVTELLMDFNRLNEVGQKKALETIKQMLETKKYQREDL